MRVSIRTVRSTVEASSCGQTAQPTPEISTRTISTVWESIPGPTEESTTDSGKTTRWTVRACSRGPMAEGTMVSMLTTKKKVRVSSPGLTVANTTATGRMASSTERVFTTQAKEKSKWESGLKANASTGS